MPLGLDEFFLTYRIFVLINMYLCSILFFISEGLQIMEILPQGRKQSVHLNQVSNQLMSNAGDNIVMQGVRAFEAEWRIYASLN